MNIQELINNAFPMHAECSDKELEELIGTITTNPAENTAKINAHLSAEVRLTVSIEGKFVTIKPHGKGFGAESRPIGQFMSFLKQTIYEIDEALSVGSFAPADVVPANISDSRPPAPEHMDMPHWTGNEWIDLEY